MKNYIIALRNLLNKKKVKFLGIAFRNYNQQNMQAQILAPNPEPWDKLTKQNMIIGLRRIFHLIIE